MKKEFIAVEGMSGAGVITWWEMHGRLDPDEVYDALCEAGMDIKVPRTSPVRALAQAVSKYAGRRASREHGAFAVAGPRGSWFLVERRLLDQGVDLELATFAKVFVDDGGEFSVAPLNGADADPEKAGKLGIAEQIVGAAEVYSLTTGRSQISTWLSGIHMRLFSGVSLRTSGGFYFVPASSRETWEKFWAVMQEHTENVVSSIDALPTEETVSAVADALRRECETTLEALTLAMKEAADTGMGEKSRNAKLREVRRMREKLDKYRALIGDSLASIDEAAGDVEVALAVIPEA